jgi:TPP-dependent pyruvate/acetoin dehydrogenase alpha subunit
VYRQGEHYGIPGVKVDGQSMIDTLKAGRAVIDYVRSNGPAILQVNDTTHYTTPCRAVSHCRVVT